MRRKEKKVIEHVHLIHKIREVQNKHKPFSGKVTSSIDPSITSTMSWTPFALASSRACSAILVASTAYTFRAPAFADQIARMPLPVPTSSIVCFNKTNLRIHTPGAFYRSKYNHKRPYNPSIIAQTSQYLL